MKIGKNQLDIGSVVGASGLQNVFGGNCPYPYHRYLRYMPGFSLDGVTLCSKTVTLEPNEGKMPLKEDGLTPKEFFPKSIYVSPRSWYYGAALNAVSLSNKGQDFYLRSGRWHSNLAPKFISVMSIKQIADQRIAEYRETSRRFRGDPCFSMIQKRSGLQRNFSCPNVGLHLDELREEVLIWLDIDQDLGMPLVPKFNLLMRPAQLKKIDAHPACDAICVSNTLVFGTWPDVIPWKKYFGSATESPLMKRVGLPGGLSGAPLFPLLMEWLREADMERLTKPIIAGGGILGPIDIYELRRRFPRLRIVPSIGSLVFLRPWNVRSTIKAAYNVFE